MKKSNGILSLKKAAKLLNKHAPEGENLAYINPEEAKLLKSRGGSGIMTLAGVPTYGILGKAWDWITEKAEPVTNWLGYTGGQGGGQQLMKDLASLWGGYEGMKESKELSEWEKQQYQEQKAQEALNQILFASQTDSGAQLLAPTNVPTTTEDVSAFTEASGIPTLRTTAVAQGGRIGASNGGIQSLNQQLNSLPEYYMPYPAAQGGRIGAFNGGIQGLMAQQGPAGFMPQQGMMPQQGLMPRPGFAFGTEVVEDTTVTEDIFSQVPPEMKMADLDNLPEFFLIELEELIEGYFEEIGERPRTINDIEKWYRGKNKSTMNLRENIQAPGIGDLQETVTEETLAALGGRIGAQGGGIMPLLNLGGMEKDYRQDGGFVPIGRKEKADDVPARLSKNEFVFTADAVRAAGGGDIDDGAQRMYNVMKNLEAGGEISQQSQGQA